jgi:hypothetical protein
LIGTLKAGRRACPAKIGTKREKIERVTSDSLHKRGG